MANYLEDDQTLLKKLKFEQAKSKTEEETEPVAIDAFYDESSGKIVICFDNGAEFAFPAVLGEGLQDANTNQLIEVEVTPLGDGLHWESLDVDLSIPHLLCHIYGSKKWMAKLNKNRGKINSKVSVLETRENNIDKEERNSEESPHSAVDTVETRSPSDNKTTQNKSSRQSDLKRKKKKSQNTPE